MRIRGTERDRKKESMKDREIFHLWFIPQISTAAKSKLDQSQESRTPPPPPVWAARAQALDPLLLPPRTYGQEAGTRTQVWNATHHATVPALAKVKNIQKRKEQTKRSPLALQRPIFHTQPIQPIQTATSSKCHFMWPRGPAHI